MGAAPHASADGRYSVTTQRKCLGSGRGEGCEIVLVKYGPAGNVPGHRVLWSTSQGLLDFPRPF